MRSRGALIRAYLPYCDEEPTGLLRFSSQLVSALNQQGADVHLLVGQLKGRPDWVASSRATVALPNGVLRARMVRPLAVIIRIFWLQVLYPLLTRKAKDATLLLLAHESAPFPAWSQISIVHVLILRTTRVIEGDPIDPLQDGGTPGGQLRVQGEQIPTRCIRHGYDVLRMAET